MAAYYGYPDRTQFHRPANYVANTSVATLQFDGLLSGGAVQYESMSPTDIASQGVFSNVPGIQSNVNIVGFNSASNPNYEPSLDIQTVTANNPLANATTGRWTTARGFMPPCWH